MAGETKYYGLQKPSPDDYVSIEQLNENADKIDAALHEKWGFLGNAADADSVMESGIYGVTGETTGLPEELTGHMQGSLLVINPPGMGEDGWCTQILTGYDYSGSVEVYRRRAYDDIYKTWTAWQATPSEEDLESLQARVGANESAIRTAQTSLFSLYDGAVTARGDITASKLSDLDVTQSGIYNVSISAPFSIDGSSDIQDGGGLLIVFGRNGHSALQFWLLLNASSKDRRLFWRFLQTEGDDGEGYVLPSTVFSKI